MMNIIGRRVLHIKFGEGEIVDQSETSIKIEFTATTKVLTYPGCFEKFVTFIDGEFSDAINDAINDEINDKITQMNEAEEKKREDHEQSIQNFLDSSKKRLVVKKSKIVDGVNCLNMLGIHQECWKYLLEQQKKNPELHFIPRKSNKKNRLNDGLCFLGGDNYLLITFWNGADDSKNFTHVIDFGILENGNAYIQLTSRDNDERAKCVEQLVGVLEEELGDRYDEEMVHYWRRFYPANLSYMDALESFIENEKPIIDKFVKENSELKLELANQLTHDKYVKKILDMELGGGYK